MSEEKGSYVFTIPLVDKSPLPCRRCGKNMRDPKTGKTFIGLNVRMSGSDSEYSAFLKVQMGDLLVNEDYSFCFECFIKAIWFSKPLEKEE